MNASDNDIDALLGCNYIDALLFLLSDPHHSPHHAALTALVAERDALKARLAELEAHPPADRDRELRERLIESALQGAARDAHMHHEASSKGVRVVYMADAAHAAAGTASRREVVARE